MKQRHKAGARLDARETLAHLGIPIGADFHALRANQVEGLLREADRRRYQRPPDANGSRGRYFHDLLQRHARLKD